MAWPRCERWSRSAGPESCSVQPPSAEPLALPLGALLPLEVPAPVIATSPLALPLGALLPLEVPVPALASSPVPVGTLVGGVGTLSLLALHPSHASAHANATTIPTTRCFIGAPHEAGSRTGRL